MDDLAACALLAVEPADRAAKVRMPAVVDYDFLSDMGRMFGAWRSDAATGCSPEACVPASVPRR